MTEPRREEELNDASKHLVFWECASCGAIANVRKENGDCLRCDWPTHHLKRLIEKPTPVREHDTNNDADCWCEPQILFEGDSKIYVHQNPENTRSHPAKADGKVVSDILKDSAAKVLDGMGFDFNKVDKWPVGFRKFYLDFYEGMMKLVEAKEQPPCIHCFKRECRGECLANIYPQPPKQEKQLSTIAEDVTNFFNGTDTPTLTQREIEEVIHKQVPIIYPENVTDLAKAIFDKLNGGGA